MSRVARHAKTLNARRVHVRGVVQGVGFRPFVYRLAHEFDLAGWVVNAESGVEIHIEGAEDACRAFVAELVPRAPGAAVVMELVDFDASPEGHEAFEIRDSTRAGRPTVRISPDLAVCEACLTELRDPADRRHGYPYLNCTECGPRYSIVLGLPYDRPATTMRAWPMCDDCRREYEDPLDRRFHAQPVACARCGPAYTLERLAGTEVGVRPYVAEGARASGTAGSHVSAPESTGAVSADPIAEAVRLLRGGAIVGIKGVGGYHLACHAHDPSAVAAMRKRKFRKEKPFALMVADLGRARELVRLTDDAEARLTSAARPIVLAPARVRLDGVAPDNDELGVMLPSTPLHHLLFDRGAPEVLVMTSGNRSTEPIAYTDEDARDRLAGLADALLVGERRIARRMDDSVIRAAATGPMFLRRARGYAPSAAASLPSGGPILAVGADLKNTVTLVVGGQAFVSQHIGDLGHLGAFEAFRETIDDLTHMYEIDLRDAVVVHDRHPEYRSTVHAELLAARRHVAVQHHRAHVASVLAERGDLEARVLGVALDGTGYGDDGGIWGCELFLGSVREGFARVAHLRPARLAGGDAATTHPVQAAAGFLEQLEPPLDPVGPPFSFPARYGQARRLLDSGIRTFATTSAGRLFDTAAALIGFTRPVTFEAQAAIWLERLARRSQAVRPYPMPFANGELDFRPLLWAVVADRRRGRRAEEIARSFHAGVAACLVRAADQLCQEHDVHTVVLSGGVFQNELLQHDVCDRLVASGLQPWTPRRVPANDGGISLGQAAVAACTPDGPGYDRHT